MTPQEALIRITEHREIFREEMLSLMRAIMSGEVSAPLIAALITGLRVKKETIGEITAAAQVMREGRVAAVVVGADRIAANGDAANKIGTYLKALAAKDNAVPFYVALPSSTIDWTLPAGWSAGEIQWPRPKRLPVGPLMDYGYEKEVVLLSDVTAPKDAKVGETITLNARASWLVCSEVCVPEETDLSIALPVAAELPPPDPKNAEVFAATRAKLPHTSPFKAVYDAGDKRFALLIESEDLVKA